MSSTEEEKLVCFLSNIQLDQFYSDFRERLHLTRIAHFDHVKSEDLGEIGLSKPEQRRLFDALKKQRRNSFISRFKPKGKSHKKDEASGTLQQQKAYSQVAQTLKCLIPETSLTLREVLGRGAFGFVKKGEWRTEHGIVLEAAVKCLKYSEECLMDFVKEANAMSFMDHPNLIILYGIVLSTPLMLVTELAPLGSLLTRLRQDPQSFLVTSLSEYMIQIVSAMEYLQSRRFIHRDLAARNVLMSSFEKVKIGDFGLMRSLPTDMDHYVMNSEGKVPFAWCAPECLKFRKFSHASDVWAFGITILELFSYGEEPWPGLNFIEILKIVEPPANGKPECPKHCPMDVYNCLVSLCFDVDPQKRANFKDIRGQLESAYPVTVFATGSNVESTNGSGRLSFMERDEITLLEFSESSANWRGQNKRTRSVGIFPADKVRFKKPGVTKESNSKTKLTSKDISIPLTDSFSHCAHRGIGDEAEWGNTTCIERSVDSSAERVSVTGHILPLSAVQARLLLQLPHKRRCCGYNQLYKMLI